MKLGNAALLSGDVAKARALADGIIADDAGSVAAILLGADAARSQHDWAAALSYYQALPVSSAPGVVDGLCSGAELAMEQGQISAAEALYVRALNENPQCKQANSGLAYLLGVEGRCGEAVRPLLKLVQLRQFGLHHLVLLGASHPVIADAALIDRCRTANPGDPLPLIGMARTAISNNEFPLALQWLEEVVAHAPDSAEGQAQFGKILQELNSPKFPQWSESLPVDAESHAGVWFARGQWARGHNDLQSAVRCFWEAVSRDSDDRIANLQLGQALVAIRKNGDAGPFLQRAQQLLELAQVVDYLYAHPHDIADMQRAAQITEGLGRYWEAWGWSMLALSQNSTVRWPHDNIKRLEPLLAADSSRTVATANPALRIDLTAFPLPRMTKDLPVPVLPDESMERIPLAFEDNALACGIDFTYRSRSPAETGEMRMYETTGGGVAIIDIDCDRLPDIYLTQGGALFSNEQDAATVDRIYRNLGTDSFAEVTSQSGLGDTSYSQGATVGDLNNDGFPDLYVANLGANQVYENLGDGTFQTLAHAPSNSPEQWTTSCLIADLNGDENPDIYDVNYLSIDDARRATCRKGEELQWCSPNSFAASQDRLYVNSGDGQFEEVSESVGIAVPNGKGLGIIAADFNQSQRISLFVANDAVANFYFQNKTTQQTPFRFVEAAASVGLAYDRDGFPQACMGVAAGDVNADGRLDLFVTNFYAQSNTLYLNTDANVFMDATGPSGLREPSYHRLGFGTQCLDAELDGWPDLVVANGHVLDLSGQGIPFQMLPQYFSNRGNGQFEEIPADALGHYFEQAALGRGLARLDWNRDGRADFVVSNVNTPAALVTNRTSTPYHYVSIQLCGVNSSRDAIGAIVAVRTANHFQVQHLTAGDGYQASNQRQLLFGLAQDDAILELSISWPSGSRDRYIDVPVDCDIIVVEHAATPYKCPP